MHACSAQPASQPTQRCPRCAADLITGTDPSALVEHGQFCREPEQCQVGRAGANACAAHSLASKGKCLPAHPQRCQTARGAPSCVIVKPSNISTTPLPSPHPQEYARGRVALVGDAAHLATPLLGMGCSLALEDACELGRAIGKLK